MNKKILGLAAVLVILVAAVVVFLVQSNAAESAAPVEAGTSTDPQRLMIPRWFLFSLALDGQDMNVPEQQQAVTIQFEEGGSANGTGGCNDFSTTYEADMDGKMVFGPVASTKMMCDATIELENAYFQALAKVEKFAFEDYHLVLSSADGKTRVVFAMPPK